MRRLSILLVALLFISCEEDSADSTNTRGIAVSINHNFNGDMLKLNETIHTNEAGNDLQISQLKYFVSGVKLTTENDEMFDTDEVFFIDLSDNQTSFNITADEGNYKSIKFYIGVDSARNHADPGTLSANNPLNPANSDMHWSWMKGYIFSSLEGYLIEDGVQSQGFSYHIGNMDNLIEVIITPSGGFEINSNNTLNLEYDLSRIFEGNHQINIEEKLVTHSTNDEGLSKRLSENIEGAISVK